MKTHDVLVKEAKQAIDRVFSDRSVSLATTKESLKELQDEIEMILDAL